ncbi:hypothetical protein PR048_014467 [Dryococelus australis]|uniref:Uncharacterized protein n=1 Tax=Dryococelus australis TaxID=614101 RepID=A0ABQ9HEI4_9NEOP|nr:hypothetical protein PR048_014467 [Dryococelus australis]
MTDCLVFCGRLFNYKRYVYSANFKVLNNIAFLTDSGSVLTNYKQLSSVVRDIIDVFADKLVEDKARKWKYNKLHKKQQARLCRNVDPYRVIQDNVCNRNDVYLEALASSDPEPCRRFVSAAVKDGRHESIVTVLQLRCHKKLELPPDCLLELACSFSRLGVVDGVKAVKALCENTNAYEYSVQGRYDHYLAEAYWTSGRLQEALDLFTHVYEHNPNLQKKVRAMSRFLVNDVISRRGEAALVLLTRFAKYFAGEYQDYHFLMVLWKYCFISNWFADQTFAANLLEEQSELLGKVQENALEMSFIFLRCNRSEFVYRLLEVLLLYKMRAVYSQVLRALFDYKCKQTTY